MEEASRREWVVSRRGGDENEKEIKKEKRKEEKKRRSRKKRKKTRKEFVGVQLPTGDTIGGLLLEVE